VTPGVPAPPLTQEQIESWHPDALHYYQAMADSLESASWTATNWATLRLGLGLVSRHLYEAQGYTLTDEDGDKVKTYPGSVRSGALTEIMKFLAEFSGTPASAVGHELTRIALAKSKATPADDQETAAALADRADQAVDRLLDGYGLSETS
jgi:hypothetical protein